MDEGKRQKVMIGVLAVMALGAGGYWYATSGSGSDLPKLDPNAPVVKYDRRKKPKEKKKVTRRKGRRSSREREAGTTVRERETRERGDNSPIKRKKGPKKAPVRKKKLVPAA